LPGSFHPAHDIVGQEGTYIEDGHRDYFRGLAHYHPPGCHVHVGWSAGMMPIERSICLVELENFTYSLRMITPISLFCDRLYA
jgi:hypothetical protein